MIEPEKPLKKKEQIRLDEELAFKLQDEEEEQSRLAKEKVIGRKITSRAERELTVREGKIVVELWRRERKTLRIKELKKRRKAQLKHKEKVKLSTYLKTWLVQKGNRRTSQFVEIQKLFDKAMTRVNMFVDIDTEFMKESSKKAEAEMAQENDEVAIDAIPLATKLAVIIDYKIHKKGRQGYYEIMRADGSSKIYLLFSQLIKSFDREDLETLWKLVKAKHGNTRPEEGYERVL
ncbi:hypothetical protein Tco_0906475 [Tanacetum coccineum]|uniref:Uncharacterized protein n=1 Tax=Tanacetum coccineum TaxID=301880 RepID=A0ABQ5CGK5_9ASTR